MNTSMCFLPFRGELGWYLMSFIRLIHSTNHQNKIVCIKPGHECLFPTVQHFFYDWQDIPDNHKSGVIPMDDEEKIKEKVQLQFPNQEITFVSPTIITWNNRHDFYHFSFIPQSQKPQGLIVDVVITPRQREIDVLRNWGCDNWQKVADALSQKNIKIGVCGSKEASCDIQKALYKSYNFIDIDSDVELMNNAKLVVTQESGLQYLSFMCKRPTFCIGHYHGDLGADLYRDKSVPFKTINTNPDSVIIEIINFLESHK